MAVVLPKGFQKPPPIPAKDVAIPHGTAKYASELRKEIENDPTAVPYELHCWLALYRKTHPYSFVKERDLERRFQEENEGRWAKEDAKVEEAKGNKLFKVMEAEAKTVEAIERAINAASKNAMDMVLKAVEAGGKIANTARQESSKETQATSTALTATISSLSEMNAKMFSERSEIFDERIELARLIKDIQEDRVTPEQLTRSNWSIIWGGFQKAAKVFQPMLAGMGIDLKPMLEAPPAPPTAPDEGAETDTEE